MTQEQLTTFLGWNAVIHIGLLTVSAVLVVILRGWTLRVHTAMFDLDDHTLSTVYFAYLAAYKLFVLVFVLVPYLVMRLAM